MPDTTNDTFEGYERKPKEISYENPNLKGIVDWDTQLERRTAEELQKLNKQN